MKKKKNINSTHIKSIALFIVALCKTKSVCFSLLSSVFDLSKKSLNCLWRIRHFVAEFNLDRDLIAHVVFRMPPMKSPFCLVIDRLNWGFGNTDINVFMLSMVHDGVTYPLLLSIPPKKVTSNSKERIDMVQRNIRIFEAKSIACIIVDI